MKLEINYRKKMEGKKHKHEIKQHVTNKMNQQRNERGNQKYLEMNETAVKLFKIYKI